SPMWLAQVRQIMLCLFPSSRQICRAAIRPKCIPRECRTHQTWESFSNRELWEGTADWRFVTYLRERVCIALTICWLGHITRDIPALLRQGGFIQHPANGNWLSRAVSKVRIVLFLGSCRSSQHVTKVGCHCRICENCFSQIS